MILSCFLYFGRIYELGEARYDSGQGEVEGEILLKRQFRIRKGKMEYMLESDLTIQDEVLQKEPKRFIKMVQSIADDVFFQYKKEVTGKDRTGKCFM